MKTAMEPTYDHPAAHARPVLFNRISWGPVFAGVSAAIIIQLLLTLLGVAIGAASVNPLQEHAPGKGLGIGAAMWFFVTSIISMYIGGRVAGRSSESVTKQAGMRHGLLTWAATTILSMAFLASALTSLLGSVAGSAAGTAAQVQATQAQQPNQPNVPAAPAVNEQDAREAGDVAARRVSQTALLTFFALLLSGLAAAMGGRSSASASRQEYTESESRTHTKPAFAHS